MNSGKNKYFSIYQQRAYLHLLYGVVWVVRLIDLAMGWPTCNSTAQEHATSKCFVVINHIYPWKIIAHEDRFAQLVHEVDLWDGGVTFHNLCVILCAILTVISFILASVIIFGHALHYSVPHQQR